MWHNHTKEYYWAIKKKKVAIYATAWMNLENTMLSKRNETQNVQHHSVYVKCP